MEAINTWLGGMNQDMSKLLAKSDTYLSATNLRPISEMGQSDGALEQIRGNNFEITIPNIWNVYKLRVDTSITTTYSTTITVAGNTSTTFNVTSSTTGLELYTYISAIPGFNVSFYAAYDNDSIIIWSTSNVSGVDPNVTFTGNGLLYVTNNSSPNVYLPAIMNLTPIGSTFIRDKYYLFTCDNSLANPGGHNPNLPTDPSQLGQIWEMIYDYTEPSGSNNTTIRLIYNNYIDFTKAHPIPPTAVEGRYENDNIQRIYWTDFFNKLRALNIADPNAMILDPSILSIVPEVDFSIPILQKVMTGGNLTAGIYQASYRLKKTNGSVTNYSIPSNLVQIAGNGQSDTSYLNSDQYRQYIGNDPGTTVNKSIVWKIIDLDTDFDQLEIVILKRDNGVTDVPDIFNIITDVIPANGQYTFTYTGNEDTLPVTLAEYSVSTTTFTHCKTIATKDNILFAGNIKNLKADIDYDARAYRYKSSQVTTELTNTQSVITTYTQAQLATLPETADAINPNPTLYKYQYNSTVIGATGPNISYTFGTVLVPVDGNSQWNNSPNSVTDGFRVSGNNTHSFNGSIFVGIPDPFTFTNVKYKDNTTLQSYPNNSMNSGLKLPYETQLFKGYKRNETYRFAIQFFDKQKNPYFAKWIGDIKFPDYYDTNSNPIWLDGTPVAGGLVTDFRTSIRVGSYEYTCQLFIKFTVNIPSTISNKVNGYSIVRAERKKNDMTISGQGLIVGFENRGGTDFEIPGTIRQPYLSSATNQDRVVMLCPDWLLTPGLYHGLSGGDYLKDVSVMQTSGNSAAGTWDNAFGLIGGESYFQAKYYDWSNIAVPGTYNVSRLEYFPQNGTITDGANNYFNQSTDLATRTFNKIQSDGSPCHWIKTASNIPLLTYTPNGYSKLIVDYYRTGITQYGGNSYTSRTNTEYILASHFRPILTSNSTITDTPLVFGGDTWVHVFDVQKLIKHWDSFWAANKKYSATAYFPIETRVNIPLRQGNYVSYNLDNDAGSRASAYEDYIYNETYNNENDILKYYPKPLNFNEVDQWDNRVIYSNIKINGEDNDSWSTFLPNNYWDVEGSYGPINALTRLRNEIYTLQDRAFSRLIINPVAMTNSADGLPVVLGAGLTIQRHQYIGIDAGTKHQWSVSCSPNSIMFVDAQKNRVYMFNGQALTAITDAVNWTFLNKELVYSIIENDNPTLNKGILTTFDYENSEYLITFLNTNNQPEYNKKTTLVYNETTNKFTSFYSFTPSLYINNNRTYYTYSARASNNLYIHNRGNIGEFYGNTPPIQLKLIMNSQPSVTKVLDNFVWHTEVIDDPVYTSDADNINMFPETWTSIRIYNDYQNTDIITLDPTVLKNIRRVERGWQLQVPRNKVLYSTSASPNIFTDLGNKPYSERMRDKTFTIELEYSNPNNYRFIMHYLKSIFRVSYK